MDTTLFQFLNGLTGQSAVADWLIIFCASYLQYELAALFVIAVLRPKVRHYRMAIAAIVSAGIARGIVKMLIVFAWHRARPYVALAVAHNILGAQTGEEYQSFPSGHAIFFFALAMAIWMYNRRLGWWFFVGATLMGIARIAGGVHWPSDILAGAALGIFTSWSLIRLIPALQPKEKAGSESQL